MINAVSLVLKNSDAAFSTPWGVMSGIELLERFWFPVKYAVDTRKANATLREVYDLWKQYPASLDDNKIWVQYNETWIILPIGYKF